MLLALGEIQRGNTGFIPYSSIEPKLKELLIDFGPSRKTIYTSFPFIRLANDALWQFNKPEIINTKQDHSNKYLLNHDLQGKFPEELIEELTQKPELNFATVCLVPLIGIRNPEIFTVGILIRFRNCWPGSLFRFIAGLL